MRLTSGTGCPIFVRRRGYKTAKRVLVLRRKNTPNLRETAHNDTKIASFRGSADSAPPSFKVLQCLSGTRAVSARARAPLRPESRQKQLKTEALGGSPAFAMQLGSRPRLPSGTGTLSLRPCHRAHGFKSPRPRPPAGRRSVQPTFLGVQGQRGICSCDRPPFFDRCTTAQARGWTRPNILQLPRALLHDSFAVCGTSKVDGDQTHNSRFCSLDVGRIFSQLVPPVCRADSAKIVRQNQKKIESTFIQTFD